MATLTTTQKLTVAFEANYEKYAACEKITDAYNLFMKSHPKTELPYNNFHYYYTKNFAEAIAAKKKEAKVKQKAAVPQEKVAQEAANEPFVLKIYDPRTSKINDSAFIGLRTGKAIDYLISSTGGIMPGTTVILTGEPGTGKSTIVFDTICSIQRANPDAKCIALSSEMSELDLQAEIRTENKDWMYEVKHVLLDDYKPEQWLQLIKTVLLGGWDFIVIDSFEDICEKLSSMIDMKAKEARNWLMALMKEANGKPAESLDPSQKFTAIMAIQQVTKGGLFVGSNALKHNTTGMIELRIDKNGERYAMFSKNRRNGSKVTKKMYYSLDDKKEVVYDEQRFNEDIEKERIVMDERAKMDETTQTFKDLFLNKKSATEDDEFLDEADEAIDELMEETID